jgi:hypothetical protein
MFGHNTWTKALIATLFILAGLVTIGGAQTQNWALVSPNGGVPSARGGHAMVYDSTHGRMVMFGGGSPAGNLNDVWEFNVATRTWTNVTPSSGPAPAPRVGHAMAYDPVRDKIVMHGGSTAPFAHPGDTWEWDTVNRSWTYMPNGGIGGGIGLLGPAMSFDPNRNQIVLFGGRRTGCCDARTYAWNGNSWIDISPANSPSGRAYHMMATDTARSKIVLFGGWQQNLLQDTWEWDGNSWTEIPTAVKPLNRHLSGMSYDSERGVMVLFGGWNGYAPQYPWNDTWTWDGQNWTLQQPCDLPSPRNSVAMAYDPIRKRHVMFGGDPTAPSTTANSTAPNAAGWNNTDVTVQLDASDGEDGTGVQNITYSSTGAQVMPSTTINGTTANFSITAEGETTITYFATDAAGNEEAPQTLIIKIDKSDPSVSCDSADGMWHASDVSIACTANDSVSGLSNAADSSFNLTTNIPANTETANALTNSRTVCDLAGNCATAGPIGGNKVDKKAPTITITTPSANAAYLLNQAVVSNYTCSDGGSGVGTCAGPVANGGNIDTASAGGKTFTVNATDQTGNTATPESVSYSVGYGVVALYDQTRVHKSGSTVPIKIQIVDANGVNYSSASLVVQAMSVLMVSENASGTPEDAGNSNPDLNFRYDPSLGGYIFNLKATGHAAGIYELHFVVGGGTTDHVVQFRIRP